MMRPNNQTRQHVMRKIHAFLFLATILLQGCGGADEAGTTAPATTVQVSISTPVSSPDPAATESRFQTLAGQPLELSAFAGKKVFLNYWATWCAPCIREIPAIARAAAALEPEGYVFLLASDESLDKISDFLQDREFSGNFIKLNGFFGAHGIHAVPSSVLYDENGAVLRSWDGEYEWDSAEMLAELRQP